jgi:kinesin family protein 4/21/27
MFTYDRCFGIESNQQEVFDICVKNLVLGCFCGFNATVLAYGQTGSGKTFTMGSTYLHGVPECDIGIIPRVVKTIFDEVENRSPNFDF